MHTVSALIRINLGEIICIIHECEIPIYKAFRRVTVMQQDCRVMLFGEVLDKFVPWYIKLMLYLFFVHYGYIWLNWIILNLP